MLIRFGVENHGSIANYQELVLTATALKDMDDGLLAAGASGAPAPKKVLRVVPVVGIYGANAAGKSTLLKAFDFFCRGIISSHSRVASAEGVPYHPFALDAESRQKPSRYDVDIVLDNVRYHYGYMLNGRRILGEWLYSFSLDAARQVRTVLFSRQLADDDTIEFTFGKSLRGENKQIGRLVRQNSLFLSVAAQNAHPQLARIFEYFYQKIVRRLDAETSAQRVADQLAAYFSDDLERQTVAIKFLKAADIGITRMDFSKIPVHEKTKLILQDFEEILNKHLQEGKERVNMAADDEKDSVNLYHMGADDKSYPIALKDESAGTLSLLRLIGPAFARLNEGGVLVVDELNSTLHPLVSRALISLFSNPVTNPGQAQLLFTTHDTNLLSGGLLRRDQIWFAEKDPHGATHIYSLSDIRVRSDDNLERGYLKGRFGAIPFVGCSLSDFTRSFEDLAAHADVS